MYHFNIDKLTARDGFIFGWGWFVDEAAIAFPDALVLRYQDGSESTVACLRSGRRDDVAAAYPGIVHAADSGFMVQGRIRNDVPIASAALVARPGGDGAAARVLEVGNVHQLLSPDAYRTAARAVGALRRNGVRGTVRVAGRRAAATVRRLVKRRAFRSNGTSGATLVIDHDLGGGANVFRRQLVERLRPEGDVYVLKPRVSSLDYEVDLYSGGGSSSAVYDNFGDLIKFLDSGRWGRIVINELVSYPSPLEMVSWLQRRLSGRQRPSEAVLYLHDFYPVCPQWTLVGRSGVFCGIPDLQECAMCIRALRVPFLSYLGEVSVADWRDHWLPLLELCDVRAFSQSTVDIVRRAFPELRSREIPVQPHHIDYFSPRQVDYSRNPADFRVAVVGHINGPKGSVVVEAAAERIERMGLPLTIVVIGSLEQTRAHDRIIHAGTFTPETLANKLEEQAVNACWVPSVCPETFSFVTSELIALGAEITCFDVGAPAERVSTYGHGRVIENFDVDAVLDHFMALRDKQLATRL